MAQRPVPQATMSSQPQQQQHHQSGQQNQHQQSDQRPQLSQRQSQQATPMAQLQGLLNIVLMTIGSTLSDPKKIADPHSQQTRMGLAVIPQATHRFHEALDKLEQDVKKAQMIMRRDYGLFLQDKEKKEEEEKARRALDPVPTPAPTSSAVPTRNIAVPSIEEPMSVKVEGDAEMSEHVNSTEAKQEKAPTPNVSTTKVDTKTIEQKQESDQVMDSLLADANAVVDELAANNLGVDDLFGTDDVADLPENGTTNMDLDAMFGIGPGAGNTPNMMNATPGGADVLNNDPLASQPLGTGDMDMSFEDGGQGPALAGLEDYANMDSDAANTGPNGNGDVSMDLPDLDFSNLGDLGSTNAINGVGDATQQPQINGIANGTSVPDGLDFGDTTANGAGDQMQTDNFDDFFTDLVGDLGSIGEVGGQGDLPQNTEGDDWSWLNG